jgi:hypothetical protein
VRKEQQGSSRRQSRTCGAGISTDQPNMQLGSWIDNVIVPILVQKILEERRMKQAA